MSKMFEIGKPVLISFVKSVITADAAFHAWIRHQRCARPFSGLRPPGYDWNKGWFYHSL